MHLGVLFGVRWLTGSYMWYNFFFSKIWPSCNVQLIKITSTDRRSRLCFACYLSTVCALLVTYPPFVLCLLPIHRLCFACYLSTVCALLVTYPPFV